MTYFTDRYEPDQDFVSLDGLLQTLLLFGTLFIGVVPFLSGEMAPLCFMMLLLGGFQLLSAFLRAFVGRSRTHLIYFLSAVVYLYALAQYENGWNEIIGWNDSTEEYCFYLFLIVIPLVAAAWYYQYTWQFIKKEEDEIVSLQS